MGTKITLTYALLALGLVEGLLKVLIPAFPLGTILPFQGMIGGGFLGVRVVQNLAHIKENGNGKD